VYPNLLERTRKIVALVAPTGIEAIKAGGQILHSFCRLGPHTLPGAAKRLQGPKRDAYGRLDAIVIDEISMCRAETSIASSIRCAATARCRARPSA
jgi:hypothetical protein